VRRCLLEPIPEIFEAAAILDRAREAHVAGNAAEAEHWIRAADDPAIYDWLNSVWGRRSPEIHTFASMPNSPPTLPIDQRPIPRMPTTMTKREIIARDGYHCKFCGIPVITSERRKVIQRLYPDALRWGRSNLEQHAAFQCMWLQYDHVLPNQRGGPSTPDNVVITCAACNFGRMEYTVEEAGLIDPRTRERAASWSGYSTWHGLGDFT